MKCNICHLCPKDAGQYINSLQKELEEFQATFLHTSQAFDKIYSLSHLWRSTTCSHYSLFNSMHRSFIPIAYKHRADRMLWVVSDHYHFPTTLVALHLLSSLRLQIKSCISQQANNFTNNWTSFKLHLNMSDFWTKFLKDFCIICVIRFRDVWTLLWN